MPSRIQFESHSATEALEQKARVISGSHAGQKQSENPPNERF